MELTSNNGGDVVQIILDISANTHKNDRDYYKKMIDELAKVDTHKHEVILKWQLWTHKMGDNKQANLSFFRMMSKWAWKGYGYMTTASVFDIESLKYLMRVDLPYELPFIKIANRRDLDWLIGEIPRKYIIYKSTDDYSEFCGFNSDYKYGVQPLYCISKYPAPIDDYPRGVYSLSDHTVGLELFHRNKPKIWEKHFKLSDSTGLDAGEFAITPEELKEIL